MNEHPRHRRAVLHLNGHTNGILQCVAMAARITMTTVLVVGGTALAQPVSPAPDCPHTAPIENRFNPAAPNVSLLIKKDVDLLTVSARIARQYGVQPQARLANHWLVLIRVTEQLVERLRCEPDIELVCYDLPVHST